MNKYSIGVFYKEQPPNPTAAQLLNPAALQPGDRYKRVFKATLSFSNGSDEGVLQQLFASFNGEGEPLPQDMPAPPRSMSIGDIITGEEACAFIVTETGFNRLPFAPRGEEFQITAELLARPNQTDHEITHPLRPGDEAGTA